MARGRPIIGVDLIDRLDSPRALRRRVRIVLATIAGSLTIAQACGAGCRSHAIPQPALARTRWRARRAAAAAAGSPATAAARVTRGAAAARAHPRTGGRPENDRVTQRNRTDDAAPARSSRPKKKRRRSRPRAEAIVTRVAHGKSVCDGRAWPGPITSTPRRRPPPPRLASRCGRSAGGRRDAHTRNLAGGRRMPLPATRPS